MAVRCDGGRSRAAGARARCAAEAGHAGRCDRGCGRRAHEWHRRVRGAAAPGARRSPRGDRRGMHRVDRPCSLASPTQRTRDSRHAGRSCAEPRAIPRRRAARRAAGEGARVHRGRDARAAGHPRKDRARDGRDRTARRADRGLARDARPGRPLAADGRRPGCGRAGVRRRSPLRGRVPEQRGPRGTRRGPAVVSPRRRGPGRVHRRALRRRARPHRLLRCAGRARALQPPCLAARTRRLVPHPLAVRRVRPDPARIIRAGRRDDDPAPSRRVAQIARIAHGSAPACGGCRRPRVRRRGARRLLPVADQERRRRDASSLGSHAAG